MKRGVWLLVLVLMLLPSVVFARPSSDPFVTDLIAGGGSAASAMDVGDMLVWNDGDNLYVKYLITDPAWSLVELHLAVANDLGLIPQNSGGNVVPGKFKYKWRGSAAQQYVFAVPLNGWTMDTLLYLAAHAIVRTQLFDAYGNPVLDACGNPVYRCETAWGEGPRFNERKNWAMYFNYTVEDYRTIYWPGPGGNNTTTVAFEDLPRLLPLQDFDYNDWVGDVQVTALMFGNETEGFNYLRQIDFHFVRQGKLSGMTHRWQIGANAFPGDGLYVRRLNGAIVGAGIYNAATGLDLPLLDTGNTAQVTATVTILFAPMCAFALPEWDHNSFHGEGLFFDPYLHVNLTGQDIHTGDSRLLAIPTTWDYPDNGVHIWSVYPDVGPAVWTGLSWDPPVFQPYWWE